VDKGYCYNSKFFEPAKLSNMDRREFLKRTAAASVLTALVSGILKEHPAILRPSRDEINDAAINRLSVGGYANDWALMSRPTETRQAPRIWFLAGWQADCGLNLLQIL
jgi:hypothetical protein